MGPLDDLDARIERAERSAMGKATSGQWTKADDEALAALYDERRRRYAQRRAHERRPKGGEPMTTLAECATNTWR